MDAAATTALLQHTLAVAAKNGDGHDRRLNALHLMKYAYLADLAHAESNGETYTGATWRFDHYGPHADDLWTAIEPAMHAVVPADTIGVTVETTRWQLDEDIENRTLTALRNTLPVTARLAVEHAFKAYGTDVAALLTHVYATEPMLGAAPGDALVFAKRTRTSKPTADPSLSAKQQKKANEAVRALKTRLAELKRAPRATMKRAPRYDAVFVAGVAWLDALDGDAVRAQRGEVVIDVSTWGSETRRTRE